MKFTVFYALLSPVVASAFVFKQQPTSVRSSVVSSLAAKSRRDVLATWSASAMVVATGVAQAPAALAAEGSTVDYGKIQDLLGPGGDFSTQYVPDVGKRPTWLTEPTDEFKESESKASEFKRKNLAKKQKFAGILEQMTVAPNNEALLVASLDEMRIMVKENEGLPLGISKDEIVKTCRRRKAKKYWPTNVEISYQDLLYEIAYQQSPNVGRDMSKL